MLPIGTGIGVTTSRLVADALVDDRICAPDNASRNRDSDQVRYRYARSVIWYVLPFDACRRLTREHLRVQADMQK